MMTAKRTLYLGRNSDNDHVYVDIRLERDDRPHETIYHHTAPAMVRLSITGTVIDGTRVSTKRAHVMTPDQLPDHTWVACGQCADALPRTALGDELRELWERWHLNDMHPSCAHQNRTIYGPHVCPQNDWRQRADAETSKCPIGYGYGSKWLAEPLPTSVLNRLCSIAGFDPSAI